MVANGLLLMTPNYLDSYLILVHLILWYLNYDNIVLSYANLGIEQIVNGTRRKSKKSNV